MLKDIIKKTFFYLAANQQVMTSCNFLLILLAWKDRVVDHNHNLMIGCMSQFAFIENDGENEKLINVKLELSCNL